MKEKISKKKQRQGNGTDKYGRKKKDRKKEHSGEEKNNQKDGKWNARYWKIICNKRWKILGKKKQI